ncbi:murein biosynthesis integral membrane protein MurJ [uncultured Aeromicrobium sp.]|uniref:murein biosynthesis integral membrane protein MurJ n=1 Tax=uncultured Aeromicrobium sp. TaxID=337820 RepID=UPI0025CFC769|nr:murein biosynthesis integral membrane protein MurJ [uncultured Aeromicrobium sp.]
MSERPALARASAWMALGTIVSRITGMLRSVVLIAVIGASLNADLFNIANSIPNSLYILVAGGVFNVVLVPQLVRAMKNDADGGDAYANRIITLGLLVLFVASVVLTIAVPVIMRLLFDPALFTPEFAVQRRSALLLMVLCMPQVFFYGAFVLVGQVLNARQRFGPMMWAPILNNLIALVMLATYAWLFGASDASDGFSTPEALLLGLGSTLGIVVQAATLVPFLRSVGFRYRPRFDFRGVGLGHTARLGAWTLGFIVVNQIAFFVVARIGSGATIEGQRTGQDAAGQTVYDLGFLLAQVPHGVITVSLATAIIPTLAAHAAEGRLERVGLELGRTLRLVMILIVPIAVAIAVLGPQLAQVLASGGAASSSIGAIGTTFSAFSVGMVAFTLHYVVLRGFYAMEDTRTPFWIQTVIAATNVLAAFTASSFVAPIWVSTILALSFGVAYLVGLAVSATLLSRRVGGLASTEMVRFLVRLAAVTLSTTATMLAASVVWLRLGLGPDGTFLAAFLHLVVVGGFGALVYLFSTHVARLSELRYVVRSLLRRA